MTNEQTIILLENIKNQIDNAIEDFQNENPDKSKEGKNKFTNAKYTYYPCMSKFDELSKSLGNQITTLLINKTR